MHEVASADPLERCLAVQLRRAGSVSRHVPAPSVLATGPSLRRMPGHTPQRCPRLAGDLLRRPRPAQFAIGRCAAASAGIWDYRPPVSAYAVHWRTLGSVPLWGLAAARA